MNNSASLASHHIPRMMPRSWPWSRRRNPYDPPTVLDELLNSPLRLLVTQLYFFLLYLRGAPFRPPSNKPHIRIVCISDSHSHTLSIPPGDVLIHAGDMTNSGSVADIQSQLDWMHSLPQFKYKICIAGNHDSYFDPKSRREEDRKAGRKLDFHGIHYLQDKSVTLKFKSGRRLNVYGASDVPRCGGDDNAFQYNRDQSPWHNRIPVSTDVLITHTPPKHHLDIELGCDDLLAETWRVRPKLHVFGHIHSGHGRQAVYWDLGQAAYERLLSRPSGGVLADFWPSHAWVDALAVVWSGLRGVLWQYLMMGRKSGSGGLLVNAALVYQSTTELAHRPQIVDI